MNPTPKLSGVFDNESTWTRDFYRDGVLVAQISAQILLQRDVRMPPRLGKQRDWGFYPDIKELAA